MHIMITKDEKTKRFALKRARACSFCTRIWDPLAPASHGRSSRPTQPAPGWGEEMIRDIQNKNKKRVSMQK